MKSTVLFVGVSLALSGCVSLSSEKVNSTTDSIDNEAPKEIPIDEAIKLEKDQKKQGFLMEFINQYNSDVRITVQEREDHWEVTVEHPDTDDGFTGGAEGFILQKQTREIEMIWHEHPMESEEVVEETE